MIKQGINNRELQKAIDYVKDCIDPAYGQVRFKSEQPQNNGYCYTPRPIPNQNAIQHVNEGAEILKEFGLNLKKSDFRKLNEALITQNKTPNGEKIDLLSGPNSVSNLESVATLLKNLVLSDAMKEANVEQKVRLVWTAMVFSSYIREHCTLNSQNVEGSRRKLFVIKKLDEMIRDTIGQHLHDINRNTYEFKGYRPIVSSIDVHQKVLQIEANLHDYATHAYLDGPKGEEAPQPMFKAFPLGFSPELLTACRVKTQNRNGKNAGYRESQVARQFFNIFEQNKVAVFTPEKENANKVFVDYNLGLELDFPFKRKIAVETDGPHHFINNHHVAPDHHFKAKILRESGWIRIPIKANEHAEQHAKIIAQGLSFEQTHEYVTQYHELIALRKQIRQSIDRYQTQYQSTDDKKIFWEQSGQYFQQLYLLDNEINTFVNAKHLENLFGNPRNIVQFNQFCGMANNVRNNLTIMQGQLSKLESQINRENAVQINIATYERKINEKVEMIRQWKLPANLVNPNYEVCVKALNEGIVRYTDLMINEEKKLDIISCPLLKFKHSQLEGRIENESKRLQNVNQKAVQFIEENLHIDQLDSLIESVNTRMQGLIPPALGLGRNQLQPTVHVREEKKPHPEEKRHSRYNGSRKRKESRYTNSSKYRGDSRENSRHSTNALHSSDSLSSRHDPYQRSSKYGKSHDSRSDSRYEGSRDDRRSSRYRGSNDERYSSDYRESKNDNRSSRRYKDSTSNRRTRDSSRENRPYENRRSTLPTRSYDRYQESKRPRQKPVEKISRVDAKQEKNKKRLKKSTRK